MAKVIKKEKEVILKEVISLEDYKKQVYDCLLKYQHRTIQAVEGATGKKVLQTIIHLPNLGRCYEVKITE